MNIKVKQLLLSTTVNFKTFLAVDFYDWNSVPYSWDTRDKRETAICATFLDILTLFCNRNIHLK